MPEERSGPTDQTQQQEGEGADWDITLARSKSEPKQRRTDGASGDGWVGDSLT